MIVIQYALLSLFFLHNIQYTQPFDYCNKMKLFLCDCFGKKAIEQNDYLNDITLEKTIQFIPPVKFGKVIKVYDGDTITIASKLPYKESPIYKFSVRLSGIDSPEIKGKTENEKKLAKISRDALYNLVFGKIVYLDNVSTEKYGRILADVYLGDLHINKWMLSNKYAIEYDGGTKKIPDEWK